MKEIDKTKASPEPTGEKTNCPLCERYYEPNEETLAAMREAESGEEMETLDLKNFHAFLKSLDDENLD